MALSETWSPAPLSPAAAGGWASRPRYTTQDFVVLLWRDRALLAAVFLSIFLLGVIGAFLVQTHYLAQTSILVRLGQEYVYEPTVGDAARGAIPNTDQLVQSEVEILTSAELKRRVLQSLGMARAFPGRADAFQSAAPDRRQIMLDQAVTAMGANLKVDTTPDAPVMRLTYSDTDPARAALVLNALLDQYLAYRTSVLQDASAPFLDQQLQAFEHRLADTDSAYQAFLATNGIDDFDAEKSSLNGLETSLTDDSYRVQARLKEIEGRLAEMGRQERRISPVIDLYHDTNPATAEKLVKLQLDRQDLLSRYKPDSQPVRDIDEQIAQVQALMAQGGGQGAGVKRSGVNPVYQTFQTEQIQLQAEGASLRERRTALQDELAQIGARRQKLTELEPQYVEFARDRDLLQDEIKGLVQRRQESQAVQSIAQKTNDNIRVVQRPTPPASGKSLRLPILALAFVFAAFTAVCAGLVRVFLIRGFPTPSSAARTLELPVLATAGLKTRG
jgi:uncharacterized protein involved in exopolysaccharide biosynthesis